MPRLLIATNNRGKLREYMELLEGLPLQLVTPGDIGIHLDVEEDGKTYAENAAKKATAFARAGKMVALADDSGLEVDALGGEPGVRSSRYAGEGVSDKERVDYLLSRLSGVPEPERTAHFKCVIAIAKPDGNATICDGECAGVITFEPRGENGFGYDPIFYIPELGKTMAQLTADVKNRISHRARAAQEARKVLEQMLQEGWQ